MIMPGNVTNIRTLRRRAGMGAVDPAILAAGAAALDSAAQGGGGGGGALPGGGGGSNVNVPVTTQTTTAVSPVFNISAGNSGGGGVTQTGSTSQSATPSSSNVMNQPQAGMPGGMPAPYDPYMTGATSPYGTPGATDSSYQYDSSAPMYPVATAGASGGLKTVFLVAGVALVAYLILGKNKGSTGTRRASPRRSRKGKRVTVTV